MQILISCGFLVLFFIGISLILYELYPAPSRVVRAAVLSYKKKSAAPKLLDLAMPLSKKLERFIRIGKYKRIKLQNTLRSAHMDITPESYIAQAAAPAILYAAVTVPLSLMLFAPISVVFVVLAVQQYFKASKRAENAVKAAREEITLELPHFASTIAEELKKGRNITAMLTSYSRVCGEKFRKELEITLADMNTGNHREALGRLSARVGSLGLSQICRGLQSVLDGNDQQVYFQLVAQTLEGEQEQQIERYIQSLHDKITPYTMLLLACMFLTVLTALGIYLVNNSSF